MDKTALVTGALSTLGLAISRKLNEHGYTVYGTARDDERDFPYGKLLKLDLENGNLDSLEEIKELDVLVNNAGVFTIGRQDEICDELFNEVIDINIKGLFKVTRMMIPLLKKSNGAIINISSINSIHPGFGGTAHYDGSKGFVSSYTRSLALETGLRVNAIAPGLIKADRLIGTDIEKSFMDRAVRKEMVDPEDLADLALFLSEQQGMYGQTVVLDNGYLIG